MPNWAFNRLTVRGSADEIKRFRAGMGEDGDKLLTTYLPCPQKLLDTESGSVSDIGYTTFFDPSEAWRDLPVPWFQGVQTREELQGIVRARYPDAYEKGRQVDENLGEFGHKTWYEWCLANWGTQWDICNSVLVINTATDLLLEFDTAWSPPVKGLTKIAALFPALDFSLEFDESGMGFAGVAHWVNGELEGIEERNSISGTLWRRRRQMSDQLYAVSDDPETVRYDLADLL